LFEQQIFSEEIMTLKQRHFCFVSVKNDLAGLEVQIPIPEVQNPGKLFTAKESLRIRCSLRPHRL
jgi:hypothetical protein